MNRKSHTVHVFVFAFLAFLCNATNLFAQYKNNVDPRSYTIEPKYIEQDFTPTGLLQNPAWADAPKVYLNNQYSPYDRDQPPVQTEVIALYSDHYLYVGFRAFDPDPSKIRAHISEHDKIDRDDQVGIILDTYNNNQFAYEFFLNPIGIQQDLIRAGSKKNMNFDMIWNSYTHINEQGYTAIFKIPLKGMHFPDKNEQTWAINFIRKFPREHHMEFSWTNLTFGNSCVLCQSGTMEGVKGIKSSNPLEIIPYAMSYQSSSLKNPASPIDGLKHNNIKGRVGGAIIYSPSTTSSLDATINPDFSQVESDASQISVNTTFALQYPEMRPFFLSNENMFQNGNNLFYSRSINQPIVAAKYTQAVGRYSIAYLTAYDRNVPIIVPGLQGSRTVQTGKEAYDNIVRGKINIGQQSHIGGMVTTRNFKDAHNYAGGLDWDFYLGQSFYLSGNANYTNTKEISNIPMFADASRFGKSKYNAAFNGEQYGGTSYKLDFSRQAKIYSFGFNYEALSPTFQAQNGFITKVNSRIITGSQSFNYYPNIAWFPKGGVSVNGSWAYDYANIFIQRTIKASWNNSFTGQTNITLSGYPVNDEWFRGIEFKNLYRGGISVSTAPINTLRMNGNIEIGRDINRKGIPELKIGKGYNYLVSLTLIPSTQFELNLQYRYSELYSLDGKTEYHKGSIRRVMGLYSFSSKLFARLIYQYDQFQKESQLYPLVYYKFNPFTKLYVGMTSSSVNYYNQYGFPYQDEFLPRSREFFFKFQYMFQM